MLLENPLGFILLTTVAFLFLKKRIEYWLCAYIRTEENYLAGHFTEYTDYRKNVMSGIPFVCRD